MLEVGNKRILNYNLNSIEYSTFFSCVCVCEFMMNLDASCNGICVNDKIAEYCEAYLITEGLCRQGSKCCVTRDIYPDKVPADLRIPTSANRNQSMPMKPTKPFTSTTSQRPKPSIKNTNRPTKPQEPSRESFDGNQISSNNKRSCDGECVSGLFALFCDKLDEEAYCPNEASCCITSDDGEKGTTPRPVSCGHFFIYSVDSFSASPNYRNLIRLVFIADSSTKMSWILFGECIACILRSAIGYHTKHIELQRRHFLL